MSTNPQENIFEVEAQIVEGTIEPIKTDDLIVVEQFPIIKEQLKLIKAAAEQDVAEALAMECTEENKQDIKKLRTSLSKQFTALEEKRKGVKNAILGPYNEFEQIYKECVTNIFKPADEQLKAKIAAVEDAQKKEKEEKALKYFNYRYFINGRHTPLAIVLSGGTLSENSYSKLQEYVNSIQGENGQHAFIIC